MSAWIDFKELRSKLDFEAVLRHYNVEVKRKGDQHHGYCPLPNHNGKKNSVSFSAHLKRGIFQCFGCGAKGNLLDFAAFMEGVDPKDGAALRKVATELQKRFCVSTAAPPKAEPTKPSKDLPVVVNASLDFELKHLDYEHPYLKGRGFTSETIRLFGLGYCSRGLLNGRIAIPIHHDGKLIGYAGRLVDDKAVNEDTPKYKLPPARERDGKLFEFRKSLIVYNARRIQNPVDDLVVVEGFPSVWWLTQMGCEATVATMGASMSDEQGSITVSLVNPKGRVWIVSDGDTAGERWAKEVLEHVSRERFCRWLKLDTGKQPTDYPPDFYTERMGT